MSHTRKQVDDLKETFGKLGPFVTESGCIRPVEDNKEMMETISNIKTVDNKTAVMMFLQTTAIFSAKQPELRTTMKRVLEEGGWNILNEWFRQALKSNQYSLLTFIIETISLMPITLDLLKKGSIARSLKSVCKLDCKPLQLASRKLLISWRKYVQDYSSTKKVKENVTNAGSQKSSFLNSLSAAVQSKVAPRKRKQINKVEPTRELRLVEEEEERNTYPSEEQFQEQEAGDSFESNDQCQPKKRVRFREENLVETFFFEMTEQECIEMHGPRQEMQFDEARHQEFLNEKKALQTAKILTEEQRDKPWTKCPLISDAIQATELGCSSEEKVTQGLREANILPTLYIDKSQEPTTPKSPEPQDAVGKTDIDLNIIPNTLQPMITTCIPYWENYNFPPPMENKPYINSTSHRGVLRRGGTNFRGRFRQQFVPYHSRPTSNKVPFRPRPNQKMHGDATYQPDTYRNNQERVYTPNYNFNKNPPPHQDQPPNYGAQNTGVCRHFLRGKCNLGQNCRFRHDFSNV